MIELFIALLTGMFTKLTDLIEDDNVKLFSYDNIVFGAVYGILIAYMIVTYPLIATLWIATILGVIFTGKIDATGHFVGLGTAFLIVLLIGVPKLDEIHLIFFTLAAVGEELVNDLIVDKGKVKAKKLHEFLSYRPVLEIAALFVSIISGEYIIFFALLCYDIGYVLTTKAGARGFF